uniref:Putative silent information regulator 2,Putative silent information regulator 2 n=1 Tax=Leishmania infantum TaxID=5671 RepID=UPI000CF01235|nr:Chain A, Putative silent information regulator 2,Putative silent information regulator 2 [Leishmania infantum]5OL0_B Chain B, Putative silent information regulator 2,Putative silent information regulator 2 [Leishmania infantum]
GHMTASPRAPHQEHVLGEPTLEGLAHYIREKNVRRILVLVGAGASVAAGIPDFRSPDTGIYANLGKYNLEDPTDAFSLTLLREKPEIFYSIARELNLWPGHFQPTAVHHFIRLLQDEGRLLRCCTQNIDGLEKAAGVSPELLVEAHGSFAAAACIECHTPFSIEQNYLEAMSGTVSRCSTCGGIVKPNVVFFGENLPDAFFDALHHDAPIAELVIIIGTSMQVHPFALLPCVVPKSVPRVVMNRERVGGLLFRFASTSSSSDGYGQYGDYHAHPDVCRDVLFRGDCQENVVTLAEYLGLSEALAKRMRLSDAAPATAQRAPNET